MHEPFLQKTLSVSFCIEHKNDRIWVLLEWTEAKHVLLIAEISPPCLQIPFLILHE